MQRTICRIFRINISILSLHLYIFYLLLDSRWVTDVCLCKCFETLCFHKRSCESLWLKSILKVQCMSFAAVLAFISCSSATHWESQALTCNLVDHHEEQIFNVIKLETGNYCHKISGNSLIYNYYLT